MLNEGIESYGNVIIDGGNIEAAGWFGIAGENVTINGGTVNATGTEPKDGIGPQSITTKVHYDPAGIFAEETVEIRGGNVTAAGDGYGVLGAVKNHIDGTGWTDKAGTEGKAKIEINTEGHELTDYKKAQFPAEADKVTVTFDSAGGSAVAAQTINKGAKATKPADPTRSGYTFDGWYKGNTAFDFNTAVNENITLTAHWKENVKPTSKAKPVALVKGIATGSNSLKFKWKKVKGAAKYEIWMSRCNTDTKTYYVKKVKTFGASKTSWTKKKLKSNTAYKFRVVAKDASGKVICKSRIGHALTGNVRGDFTNAKSLKVKKSSFTLKKGRTARIKATQTKVMKGKKLLDSGHSKLLRYKSNNTSVAKVSSSGKITAVGTGSCKVYVQTVNGIWKTVKVSVK